MSFSANSKTVSDLFLLSHIQLSLCFTEKLHMYNFRQGAGFSRQDEDSRCEVTLV